jgi:hypothetical protein
MTLPGDWYGDMHTTEEVAAARLVLMWWIERTGKTDDGARMADRITARAVELCLEEPMSSSYPAASCIYRVHVRILVR